MNKSGMVQIQILICDDIDLLYLNCASKYVG